MLIASTTSKIVSFEDMAEEINELRQETRLFSRNHREVSEWDLERHRKLQNSARYLIWKTLTTPIEERNSMMLPHYLIDHFGIHFSLHFKASLLCYEYQFSFILKLELITTTKISHLDSLSKRDWGELGNGLVLIENTAIPEDTGMILFSDWIVIAQEGIWTSWQW